MMEQLILDLVNWFKDLSYIGIFLALCIEFIPAEVVLPLSGFWVSEGDMRFWGVVIAGSLGGVVGPLTLYALGRFGGRPFIEKYGKYFFIKEDSLRKADAFFEKHGAFVAFSARFLPGVRTIISIPCGMAKMNVWAFSLYTLLAMAPITFFYVYLGVKLGQNWADVKGILNEYMLPFGMALVIGFIVYLLIKRKKNKEKTESINDFMTKK
ncbi:DedA family protein [Cytobacillus horneckiae]|uniref:DedA family protein n=1 Tax=Cytobacillus horneckiae TaxID=549687 RepID=A0A2N0ZEX1_9BACI|nr:DedA family protein [Cytobacillus horneckiae]MCM3176816.1 DedA family protein [Cytobacillus horneckiae]MEC1156658.1 DedA family protein [Cytobacillus horneckiae]MED2939121.1 DedA family protein [Cytobacillus horneckiae]PKG28060.1 DedA family protein [Cytobacillus horneckiae]